MQIILLIFGIIALFKKRIALLNGYEMRRPKTYVFGIVTIVLTLSIELLLFSKYSQEFPLNDYGFILWIIEFGVPIFMAKRFCEKSDSKSKNNFI